MRNSEINSVDDINEYWDSLDYEAFEESENEDSEEIEDSEEEDSEDSESSVQDIGHSNESEISTESGEPIFEPNYNIHEDYLSYVRSETLSSDSYDYTYAFEDLLTVGIFTVALVLGLFLGLAFIKGLCTKNECCNPCGCAFGYRLQHEGYRFP